MSECPQCKTLKVQLKNMQEVLLGYEQSSKQHAKARQFRGDTPYHIPTDMAIIANYRLDVIKAVGVAGPEEGFKIKPFKCGTRAYVLGSTSEDEDIIFMVLPNPDTLDIDKLAFCINGLPPHELWVLEDHKVVDFKELEPIREN